MPRSNTLYAVVMFIADVSLFSLLVISSLDRWVAILLITTSWSYAESWHLSDSVVKLWRRHTLFDFPYQLHAPLRLTDSYHDVAVADFS